MNRRKFLAFLAAGGVVAYAGLADDGVALRCIAHPLKTIRCSQGPTMLFIGDVVTARDWRWQLTRVGETVGAVVVRADTTTFDVILAEAKMMRQTFKIGL